MRCSIIKENQWCNILIYCTCHMLPTPQGTVPSLFVNLKPMLSSEWLSCSHLYFFHLPFTHSTTPPCGLSLSSPLSLTSLSSLTSTSSLTSPTSPTSPSTPHFLLPSKFPSGISRQNYSHQMLPNIPPPATRHSGSQYSSTPLRIRTIFFRFSHSKDEEELPSFLFFTFFFQYFLGTVGMSRTPACRHVASGGKSFFPIAGPEAVVLHALIFFPWRPGRACSPALINRKSFDHYSSETVENIGVKLALVYSESSFLNCFLWDIYFLDAVFLFFCLRVTFLWSYLRDWLGI